MPTDAANLVKIVRDHTDRWPDRELLTFRSDAKGTDADQRLTYGGLWCAANAFARAIDPCEKDARVLIVLPFGLRLVSAHLGTMMAGAIPIIHSHPSQKMSEGAYLAYLTHVLKTISPSVVITNRNFGPAIRQASSGSGHRVVVEEDVTSASGTEVARWKEISSDSLAVIQHSSGSTGLQKGVALTHAMVQGQCAAYARRLRIDPERDRICSWIPLYHDMGLFTTWLLPLISAVPVAAIDPFAWIQKPVSLLQLITDFSGTLCWQPNFAYNVLATKVRDEELREIRLGSMRGFNNCSEPVRASSHEIFRERFQPYGLRPEALWVCYAMAENSFAVTSREGAATIKVDADEMARGRIELARDLRSRELVSVGTPIEGCEVMVVDEKRTRQADSIVGEVAIRSPYLLNGYYRDPETTAKALDDGHWYYTGDLGFLRDGELYITGRKKDLLIVAGRNFYPQDIEQICDQCSGAIPGRSVSIGVDDEKTGTSRIVVLCESWGRGASDRERLAALIRRRVFEELDCPLSEVHIVAPRWLLKTSSGKIARQPNLARLSELASASVGKASGFRPVLEAAAWGCALALAAFIAIILRVNPNWGIYAKF